MRTRILISALFGCFVLLTSCNKEDIDNPQVTQEDMANSAKTDAAVDDVSSVVLEQFNADLNLSGRTSENERVTPDCVTVTRVLSPGPTLTPGTTVTKTINFGTEGCTMRNGNILKGKIIISFIYQPQATEHVINYSFENFYHNDIKLEGSKTVTIKLGTTTANPNTHLIFKIDLNLTVTLPGGRIIKIKGTKTREIIEGQSTPELADNVYQVTGNWETIFPNGAIRTATITSPLIIKMNCHNIVKGIIEYKRNDLIAILDFGDGTCDNQATLTIDGVQHLITLRGR